MSKGFYTDNSISQGVMNAFSRGGVKTYHIREFDPAYDESPIFYGILRGTGAAMRHLQFLGENYWYLDNGYFDAVYLDENKRKEMSGTYRVVKNAMIEPMQIEPIKTCIGEMRILVIPPSPYTAFMHDTTPEDWLQEWGAKIKEAGHTFDLGNKQPGWSFDKAIADYDAVFAFNSMSAMRAIELGKAVYTTHGIIRNSAMIDMCAPYFDVVAIRKFYAPKQFTLEQIADLGVECLK